jgi:double zinc ribbon protein
MPQCPHCQAAYEEGQRYCNNCGSFLMHPEAGDTFCPQCGVRVSPRQQYCHECDAPLKGEAPQGDTAPAGEASPPGPAAAPGSPPAPPGLPPWARGALAGAGIIIILLLIVIFSRIGTSPAPPGAPSPAPPTLATPGAPAQTLTAQLEAVLATLRNAQLQKNISDFMSVYSQSFPTYDLKRQDTLKYWEGYDFTNLVFTVDKVQAIDPDHALASVIWYLDVRNRETKELSSSTQRFQVKFVKEKGNWRIIDLNEEQKGGAS